MEVNGSRAPGRHKDPPRSHGPVCCVWCGQFSAPGPTCEVCGSPLSEPGPSSVTLQASAPAPEAAFPIPEASSGPLAVEVKDQGSPPGPPAPPEPHSPNLQPSSLQATARVQSEWVTLNEAARMAGISEESLWRCVQAGLVSTPAGVGTDDGGSLLLRTEDLRLLGLLMASSASELDDARGAPRLETAPTYSEPVSAPESSRPAPRATTGPRVEPAWVVRPTATAAKLLRRRSRLKVVGIVAAFFLLVAIVDFVLRFVS